MRRAYSSILIRRMRSSLTFSNERRSPSRRAMRAYKERTMSTVHTIAQDVDMASQEGEKSMPNTKTSPRPGSKEKRSED